MERFATDGDPAADPVPAATVVVARDAEVGIEVLMLRRNSTIAFGGMWVFPGGRVDAGDADPSDPDQELGAARRAAVREAAEEAGLRLVPGELIPFSHWTPPSQAPRRFTTWFFLARAPSTEVRIDGGEIHEHAWLAPSVALARQAVGEIELAPPTWVTLWRLTTAPDVDGAAREARRRDPERFETHVAVSGDRVAALWHGDAGYEDRDLDRPGPRHRLWMRAGGWHYERD